MKIQKGKMSRENVLSILVFSILVCGLFMRTRTFSAFAEDDVLTIPYSDFNSARVTGATTATFNKSITGFGNPDTSIWSFNVTHNLAFNSTSDQGSSIVSVCFNDRNYTEGLVTSYSNESWFFINFYAWTGSRLEVPFV